ncbi:MAG: DUF4291 domain-containing protein [Janthinobacterium lividum]
MTEKYEVRAGYDEKSVRVYQAFGEGIADGALAAGRFVEPFRLTRMSWIKPSFNWMMYRSGFAEKHDQTRILAIDLAREGFDWLIRNAVLSHFDPDLHATPEQWNESVRKSCVRVQWDPERDWKLDVVPTVRTIQLGLSGSALHDYVNTWTVRITDVTSLALQQKQAVNDGALSAPDSPALQERPYPVPGRESEIRSSRPAF